MIEDKKVSKILYGGDYNPTQWPEEIWQEDMRLFSLAKVDVVSINIFDWALNQPDEETYDFSILDKVMDLLRKNNIKVCLGTGTAAHPAWMAKKYPDILRVEFNGMKRKFGGRHNSCPNSPTFKKYASEMVKHLSLRYKDYNNIVAWHVSNEYGGACYCENCEKQFRVWLKRKYKTIERLNEAWNTRFWGHTFYSFDEIVVPNLLSEHFEVERTMFQGISLDYARFNSDSMLENFITERNILKKITPNIQITTNFMGFYKPLDYFKWAKYLDFIAWDNYPSNDTSYEKIAMSHDLMRGLKGGKPFALMEQTPSVTNWLPYNALKRPGVMRLWSYEAVAHGSDTVMFFQMRRTIGACEKFHGALIDHVGNENTRVFRECSKLGEELQLIGDKVLGGRIEAKVAIVFDWDNWWAIEYSAGPSLDLKYVDEVFKYYKELMDLNIPVDIISTDDVLDKYEVVIAPVLYMIKKGYKDKLEDYVAKGGTFVTTFFSGIVNENDKVKLGGYPGDIRKLMGIWVEEIDALPKGVFNEVVVEEKFKELKGSYKAELLCDIIHLEGAEMVARYGKDFYKDTPCITKNKFKEGEAWYVATSCEDTFLSKFINYLCVKKNIKPILCAQKDIEVTRRVKEDREITFVLNHSEEIKNIVLDKKYKDILKNEIHKKESEIKLNAKGVLVLESI
ncbi:beta-galactosidase [Clostridium felsineum]|uniref:beta-galactosidase n=1 Tax=Clostridium felsineum TaxID=36839 RepID=UPI0009C9303E|nr:beta-galactosidase [Clostridium felsineum]URZ15685.1 Beta-galactosidase BgaP [Clostridium felsineum DSM 794]